MARWFIQEPNTAPTAPQSCSWTSCGKGRPSSCSTTCLVALDHGLPVGGDQFGVERDAAVALHVFEDVLEMVMLHAEHDVAVHLDEAAVAVIGEARVAAAPDQALHRDVVEAEVEDGVHHAGHGGAGAGADRDQQRVVRIAEAGADALFRRRPAPPST